MKKVKDLQLASEICQWHSHCMSSCVMQRTERYDLISAPLAVSASSMSIRNTIILEGAGEGQFRE